MTTLYLRKSTGRSPRRLGFFLITLVLICFGLLPTAGAQLPSPTPDGGYPGNNTAEGQDALLSLTTGLDNTAIGFAALLSNTTGTDNTATGAFALDSNISGNTANGAGALFSNTTGASNIALGFVAGYNLTTGDHNIDIGTLGVAGEARTTRIGTQGTQTATYVAGISGAGVAGVPVKVNAAGRLGTAPSSERFKQNIKPMDKASEAILALRPVTFRYKPELDAEGIPQFGLVAEEVEKVNPNLVARDDQGKTYTVRYEAVNAMLLNEFLKEHKTVQELKSILTKQAAVISQQKKDFQSKFAAQQKQITALAAGLQTVSTHLEMNKPATTLVLNSR